MTAPKGVDRMRIWQEYLDGVTQVRIAQKLGIARQTVRYHLTNLKKEMGSAPDNATPLSSSTTEAVSNGVTDSIVAETASPTN